MYILSRVLPHPIFATSFILRLSLLHVTCTFFLSSPHPILSLIGTLLHPPTPPPHTHIHVHVQLYLYIPPLSSISPTSLIHNYPKSRVYTHVHIIAIISVPSVSDERVHIATCSMFSSTMCTRRLNKTLSQSLPNYSL